jgi:TRAP-type uncharacterized transport system substrate-binding protein
MSLGTLFYEPLWFFYRGVKLSVPFKTLHGRKLSVGPEGSATRVLALQILTLSGIDGNVVAAIALERRGVSRALRDIESSASGRRPS